MPVSARDETSALSVGLPPDCLKDATSVNEMAPALVDHTNHLFGVDFTSLYIWDGTAGVLKLAAFHHQSHWAPQQICTPGSGVFGTALVTKAPVLVGHYAQSAYTTPRAVRQGVASALAVPVLQDGVVLGVLGLGGRVPNRFTEMDAKGLEAIAADAAPTLFEALREGSSEIRPPLWHSMRRRG